MSTDPDQIREQIAATRSALSEDVNELADTVNPAHVARRQVTSARSAVRGARERIMGATSQTAASANAAASDALSGSAGRLRSQAAGNPLAVGLIAVGVGWMVGSLLPASTAEQQAAARVKQSALPVATGTARQVAENLQEPAQQAVESVRSSASDAAAAVKDETVTSAQDLQGQARDAKDAIQAGR